MATAESVDIKLFCELKDRFPDLPEPLVTYTVKQHHNNRSKCLEILDQEKLRMSAFNNRGGNFNHSGLPGGAGRQPDQMNDRMRNLHVHCDRSIEHHPEQQRAFIRHSQSDGQISVNNPTTGGYVQPIGANYNTPQYNSVGYSSGAVRFNTSQYAPGYNQYGYYNNPLITQHNFDQNGAIQQQPSFQQNYSQNTDTSYHRQYSQPPQTWQNSLSPQTEVPPPGRPESPYAQKQLPFTPYSQSVHETTNSQQQAFNNQSSSSYMNPLFINTSPERPQYLYTQTTGNHNYHDRHHAGSPVQQQLNFNQLPPVGGAHIGHQTAVSEPGTPTTAYSSGHQINASGLVNKFFPSVSVGQQQQKIRPKADDNEQLNLLTSNDADLTKITQKPIQPSPASSMSSLNSYEGRIDGKTSRSNSAGGTPDEIAYTQALLLHQRACFERLRKELEREKVKAESTRLEVELKERELLQRKLKRSNEFPTPDDIAKFRDENRRLRVDIEIMAREIDHYNNGQAPLGVLDPIEQQSFYSNMSSTGQSGPLRIPSSNSLQALAHQNPPAPPPPPDPDPEEGDSWNCSACTFLNHPALDKCECCDMPRLTIGVR